MSLKSSASSRRPIHAFCVLVTVILALGGARQPLQGQVLESLEVLSSRTRASHRLPGDGGGPKAITTADFDADGRPDFATAGTLGTVSVFFNTGGAEFTEVLLDPAETTLRDIASADWTGDGLPDILVTAPMVGDLIFIQGLGARSFAPPRRIPAWVRARNIGLGDFDGDGGIDVFLAGDGLGGRQYRAGAGGELIPVATFPELRNSDLVTEPGATWAYLKPVYTVEAFRPEGAARDELLVVNAQGYFMNGFTGAALLVPDANGILQISAELRIPNEVRGLKTGKLLRPGSEPGPLDLITLHTYPLEEVHVFAGVSTPVRFASQSHQRIVVPGGPRAAAIADLDGDGWNDVVIVVRNQDKVLTLRNVEGRLALASTAPTGLSPRDIVQADFSGDGLADVAVINRRSSDISVLTGYPGEVGFASLDAVYTFDGDLADVVLSDLDKDGRTEVLTLNRASGELGVHRPAPDGLLASPTYYFMGSQPNSMVTMDVNGDGHIDVAVGAMDLKLQTGILGLRGGSATGDLGPLRTIPLSSLHAGAYIFSVKVFDLDGDGVQDLAVGIFDCSGSRIVFLKGEGEGLFSEANVVPFPRARGMGLADFDGDGDPDFAAVSLMGHLVILENKGSLLRSESIEQTTRLDLQERGLIPMGLEVHLIDPGTDPDLLVPTQRGVLTFLGGPGLDFDPRFGAISGDGSDNYGDYYLGSATPIIFDINGDGVDDMVALSPDEVGITVYFGTQDGQPYSLERSVSFPIPAGRRLAAGDLDGDGVLDLVGAGHYLWTALSSRRPRLVPPRSLGGSRARVSHVVINEVLAINNDLESPLPEDAGKKPDWVEIYGAPGGLQSLEGWQLVVREPGQDPAAFRFPAAAAIVPQERRLVIFSPTVRSPYHTGFKLPGDGAQLELLDASGAMVDQVTYGLQFDNVSFGRYEDGVETWTFLAQPSPGLPNVYTGSVPPQVELVSVEVISPEPGRHVLRIEARGRDDSGMESLAVFNQWYPPGGGWQRHELEDVTSHEEETSGVRTYRGEIHSPDDYSGVLRLLLEATDLSGLRTSAPEGGSFRDDLGADDAAAVYYLIAAGRPAGVAAGLEISELVAKNENGIVTRAGTRSDWLELRNCSTAPVDLSRLRLTKSFDPEADSLALPATFLEPGAVLLVFCDGLSGPAVPGPAELHAPFTLDAGGDQVLLIQDGGPAGDPSLEKVPILADAAVYRDGLEPDMAWARPRCGSEWAKSVPTPGFPNDGAVVARGDVNADRRIDISDPVGLLGHLFLGSVVSCPGAGDVDADGEQTITDAIVLLQVLFQGGRPLQGAPVPAALCRSPAGE